MIGAEFRAWDQEEKKMYYNVENTYDWHGYGGDCKCPATCFGEILESNDFIVMQYTGLRDSKRTEEHPNGQKIFIDDIVKITALNNDHGQRGATSQLSVKYWMGNACLCEQGYDTGTPIYPLCVSHNIEVIGNFYENPELSNLESLDT